MGINRAIWEQTPWWSLVTEGRWQNNTFCVLCSCTYFCVHFKKKRLTHGYVYWFERNRKGGGGREKETLMWERNIVLLPPIGTLAGDWTCNLGTCPNWESKPQSGGARDDAPNCWATQSGLAYTSISNFSALTLPFVWSQERTLTDIRNI